MKLKTLQHHRNGICGGPFWICLFTDKIDGKSRNFMGTAFADYEEDQHGNGKYTLPNCMVAVIDVDMAAAGNITFGENSWRGDHYADQILAWINEREMALTA